MYLAGACDAAGGLPGVQLTQSWLLWRELVFARTRGSAIPVRRESASRITVFRLDTSLALLRDFPVDHALTAGDLPSESRYRTIF
jgi:hypothetical protein